MGAFHAGHASLIAGARARCDVVAVSIFVNPLQFGTDEDYERYPRDEDADLAACERLGVDLVWAPTVDTMYPPDLDLPAPDPGPVGDLFEGAARPGHFAGVLKVVHRLFDVTGPCVAYLGEKDAQQLFLIRRMVAERGMPVEVIGCPTVREADGLACSSRNAYLAPAERAQAGCLFLGLSEAAALARAGERDAQRAGRRDRSRGRRHGARASRLRGGGGRGDVHARWMSVEPGRAPGPSWRHGSRRRA